MRRKIFNTPIQVLPILFLFLFSRLFFVAHVNAQGTWGCTSPPGNNTPCYFDPNQTACFASYRLPSGTTQICADLGFNNNCSSIQYCESIVQETPAPTSSQLNLPAIYQTIQSQGGAFSFSNSPGSIVSALLKYIFPIAGLILLLMLILGGYNMMLSGGDPKKAASAKAIITTAAVGFIIIFSAYWIVKIVANVLGLGDITSTF